MMKHMQKTICALAVLATTSLPALAESVDVRVIGTINPTACTPTLSGLGTIDYGTIKPNELNNDTYTVLDEKQIDFTITCDAPAKMAITAVNGRPDTVAGATEGAGGAAIAPEGVTLFGTGGDTAVVGLGVDGTTKIGGYGVRIDNSTVTADGESVTTLNSSLGTSGDELWGTSAAGGLYHPTVHRAVSWGAAGTRFPTAFTTLNGKLGVQAYINHASELDLTKPVRLDGLTTIELVYL